MDQDQYNTIMYQEQEYRSPLWGSSPPQCEQDFWVGANSSTSTSPSSSPNGFFVDTIRDVPQFTDVSTKMDYDEMEAFGSVILPERSSFGPDDLFPDLVAETLADNDLKICLPPTKPNKITIKLKKVRSSKRQGIYQITVNKKSNDNMSPKSTEPCSIEETQLMPRGNGFFLERFEQHGDFTSLLNLATEVHESRLDDCYPPTTDLSLINALSMDNTGCLLDTILSENSPTRVVDTEMPKDFMQPDVVFVDDCSISVGDCSSPLGLSSPISIDYYSDMSSPPSCSSERSVSSPLSYSDISLLSPTSDTSMIEHHSWVPTSAIDLEPLEYKVFSSSFETKKGSKLSKESKYLRKKQQNKEAAIRYRQKKRVEDEDIFKILTEEENSNNQLKKDYKSLKQEVSFMKKLMRETFAARLGTS